MGRPGTATTSPTMCPVEPAPEKYFSTAGSKLVSLSEEMNDPNGGINPPKRSSLQSIMIVAACTGTLMLNVSAISAVSMAISSIARDLLITADETTWVISAFSLSSGCLLLLFGRLADLYGRKLVWMFGVTWTVAISIGCSLAQTGTQLTILRAMHGIGPAAMVPAAVGILAHSFPPGRSRSTAFATFSAGAPLGGGVGIVLGGLMAQYATWKWVFRFIAGMGVIVGIAGVVAIDTDPQKYNLHTDHSVDWPGAFLITVGLVLVTFALGEAPRTGWATPLVISLLVIGVIFIVLFLRWEKYVTVHHESPPIMSMDIWTRANGRFGAMQAVAFMEWACFSSLTLWAALYYQNYVRLDPIDTMTRFLPMSVTGFICLSVVALTVGTMNGAYLLALGTGATSIAALLFALIDPSSPYWYYGFPAAITCVFGADFVFAVGTLFIARIAHPWEQSVAGAIFQTVIMLGASFGLAITTIAQAAGSNHEAAAMGITVSADATALEIPPEVLLRGYRTAQWTSFAFGVVGLVVTAVFLHDIGVVGSKKEKAVVGPEEAQPEREVGGEYGRKGDE